MVSHLKLANFDLFEVCNRTELWLSSNGSTAECESSKFSFFFNFPPLSHPPSFPACPWRRPRRTCPWAAPRRCCAPCRRPGPCTTSPAATPPRSRSTPPRSTGGTSAGRSRTPVCCLRGGRSQSSFTTQPPTVVCKNGSSFGPYTHIAYTLLHIQYLAPICMLSRCLLTESELSRKFIKSALLVGYCSRCVMAEKSS